MTSELKPCKNCGGKSQSWAFGNRVATGIQHNRLSLNDVDGFFYLGCDDCGETLQHASAEKIAEQMNTRAAPDVPELVRYGLATVHDDQGFDAMMEHYPDGEYVLHSQAAEIIAVERVQKHRAQKAIIDLERRLADFDALQ